MCEGLAAAGATEHPDQWEADRQRPGSGGEPSTRERPDFDVPAGPRDPAEGNPLRRPEHDAGERTGYDDRPRLVPARSVREFSPAQQPDAG